MNYLHRIRNLPDTGEKRDKIVRSDYDGHPSVPEGKARDMVCHGDDSLSLSVKDLSIIDEDDEGMSNRVLSFVVDLADVLLPVAMKRDA